MMLRTDSHELLVMRRRLSLQAEWLYDRLRLFLVAEGNTVGVIEKVDLPLVLDRKLNRARVERLVAAELDPACLVFDNGDTLVLPEWEIT